MKPRISRIWKCLCRVHVVDGPCGCWDCMDVLTALAWALVAKEKAMVMVRDEAYLKANHERQAKRNPDSRVRPVEDMGFPEEAGLGKAGKEWMYNQLQVVR
jgi:hypothetical protein